MKRRSFIKNSSFASLALTTTPISIFQHNLDYTIEELMGKADIELFGEDINLKEEAYDAFLNMRDVALDSGIDIKIVSSYRSFERQAQIFERKYLSYTEESNMIPLDAIDKIVEYSTIPGTSRHHWGTDMDIIDGTVEPQGDVLVTEKFEGKGPYSPLKEWMDKNSESFGFYLVYTDDPKRRGFKYEPWHYSYAPLSKPMLTAFRSKNIMKQLEKEEFIGSDQFTSGFLKSYIEDNVLDINPYLL
ncbi:M15 family metallopeptidase [Eudoraea chungangensis]|uniref:M15 family metallopeptidase n=1 Tax=Eudoraea chungangensis TaxID=1481905 RepID=UPI0023EAC822|nr:M15 family metallopeptidase [Eudoraea chungangensis]